MITASSIAALIVCTALALSFSNTRGTGILGTGILILLFPVITLATLLVAGIAALSIHLHKKGN